MEKLSFTTCPNCEVRGKGENPVWWEKGYGYLCKECGAYWEDFHAINRAINAVVSERRKRNRVAKKKAELKERKSTVLEKLYAIKDADANILKQKSRGRK